ncbi:UNVERIFIED_ORG: DUF3486 family protein [Roseateles sp. XES5]|nr:phage protein Gp27 family protein [Roseateles sp. XES5]
MAPHTRPRPTAIDELPEECEAIVSWAAQALAKGGRAQTKLYKEFADKLTELKAELGIEFVIPHYSSFTRHNTRLKALMDRQRRAQMIADAVVTSTDGEDEDRLTRAAARMLRTLIVEMMEGASDGGFKPKEAASAAQALRHLAAAEGVSTARRQKLQAEIEAQTKQAVITVAKAEGLSEDTAQDILSKILGVDKA